MNKLTLFEPFEFYRELSTKYLFFEDRKPKFNTLVSVLSPSIKDEFEFIKNNQHIVFRYLEKYLIDLYQVFKLYPGKRYKEKVTLEMIQQLYSSATGTANLQDIDIIINNPRTHKDLLRNKNVLIETNYILNRIINNSEDKRSAKLKRKDIMFELERRLQEIKDNTSPGYNRILIIPVNQWLNYEEYRSIETFKATSDNLISHIYNFLAEDRKNAFIFDGWKIMLVNHCEVMILDMDKYLNDLKSVDNKSTKESHYDTLETYIKYFLKMCRFKSATEQEAIDDAKDYTINKNLHDITDKSQAAIKTEEILSASGIDSSSIEEENLAEIETLVQKAIKETGTIDDSVVKKISNASGANAVEVITDSLAATLSKQSRESYARNKMLKEKYKTHGLLKVSGELTTFGDLPDIVKPIPIKPLEIPVPVINEDLKTLKTPVLSKTYNDELFDRDLMSIIKHFATCDPAMYPIDNLIETDVSDEHNRLIRYSITLEDTNRKRHNLKFLLPKWYQDQYLLLNGSLKYINYQKVPFPIVKIQPNVVQLSTLYNKVFVYRAGGKTSPKITKLMKYFNGSPVKGIHVVQGDSSKSSEFITTTIEYNDFCRNYDRILIGKTSIIFDLIQAVNIIGFHPSEKGKDVSDMMVIPVATDGDMNYYLDTRTNEVITDRGVSHGQLSDFIVSTLDKYTKTETLSDISSGTKFNYSYARIMNEDVPVIILVCSMAKGGLIEVLETAGIKYEFHAGKRSVKYDKLNQGTIRFSDGILVYNLYPYEASLLLNGLSVLPTSEYSFLDFASRDVFIDVFDNLYGRRNLIEALENFRQLFMDPINYEICLRLGLPTDIIKVFLYSNDLLADNNYISDVTYKASRIRKNELVMAYLYKVLSTQYGKYRISPDNTKFTIPEDAVIKEILSSQLVDEYSKLNVPLALEMDQEIKSKGPSGLNVDQAYTLDKRAYDSSMLGVLGSASAPSGEVGVKRHLTGNANIIDARGFVDVSKDPNDLSGSELFTPGELLNPFSNEKSDATRAAMSINQAKQIVPTERSTPDIISYGMERIAPYMNNAFSYAAKDDGKVLEISEDIMIVQYKDGSIEDIDMKTSPVKHTNSAKFFMSERVSKFKPGDSFKKGSILAYDPKQMQGEDFFGCVSASTGILVNVAFIATGETYEDSKYISERLAIEGSSKVCKETSLMLSKFSTIRKMVKVGDSVRAGEPLIVYDDTGDEFTSEMSRINRDQRKIYEQLSNTNFITEFSGKIVDIKVYYGVDESELSSSIKSVIKEIQKPIAERHKVLDKYSLKNKSNTIIPPAGKSVMDANGRIKGIKVEDKVLFEFIIEYNDVISSGDKMTCNSAVKGINSHVVPQHLTAYPLSDPSFRVDDYVSTIGVSKRKAHEIYILAVANKIVIDYQRQLQGKYGEAVKRVLGKSTASKNSIVRDERYGVPMNESAVTIKSHGLFIASLDAGYRSLIKLTNVRLKDISFIGSSIIKGILDGIINKQSPESKEIERYSSLSNYDKCYELIYAYHDNLKSSYDMRNDKYYQEATPSDIAHTHKSMRTSFMAIYNKLSDDDKIKIQRAPEFDKLKSYMRYYDRVCWDTVKKEKLDLDPKDFIIKDSIL